MGTRSGQIAPPGLPSASEPPGAHEPLQNRCSPIWHGHEFQVCRWITDADSSIRILETFSGGVATPEVLCVGTIDLALQCGT